MSLALLEPPTDRSTRNVRPKARRASPTSLSVEEERTLLERIRQGDQKALERLVLANLGLVGKIAGCYLGWGLAFDDLNQEGIRGLIRACHDFKPKDYDVRFSTYAMYWIRSAIQQGIMNGGSTIRLPNYITHLRVKYRRAVGNLNSETFDKVNSLEHRSSFAIDQEIASRMGVSLHTLVSVRKSELERSQFHRESGEPDEIAVEETLADDSQPHFELDTLEEIACLREAIEVLTPVEAWIIRQRFGLEGSANLHDPSEACATDQELADSEPKTINWIARVYGLSPSTIRRCEASALAKLKNYMRKRFGDEE